MNLLLLLLILIGIYIINYLYNRYNNYSIQDAGNIKIPIIENNKDNQNNPNNQDNPYNPNNQDNIILTETQLSPQINNFNYIDNLIKNVDLDIKIPDIDNPNCVGKNNQIPKLTEKNNNLINLYLMANSTQTC